MPIDISARLRRAFAVAAGLSTLVLAAGAVRAEPPTAQEIRDRLSGNTPAAAKAPSIPSAGGMDPCSYEAMEANPSGCTQSVTGPDRAMSLTGPLPSGGHRAAAMPTAARAVATSQSHLGGGVSLVQGRKALIHRAGQAASGAEAATCSVQDSGDANAANLCVTFALNSAELTGQSRTSLDHLAQVLVADFPNRGVRIEGFADASGDARKNTELSGSRAHTVVDYLVTKGVNAARLQAQGYGATRPIVGHAATDPLNRRVEARLVN